MSCRPVVVVLIPLGFAMSGCQKEDAAPTAKEPATGAGVAHRDPEATSQPAMAAELREASEVEESDPLPPPERVWGRADLDETNDEVVAPPDPVPDCHARLDATGVKYQKAQLPLKQIVREIPTCGCHDAVTLAQAPLGMKVAPPAVVSCQMALALTSLEALIQELAEQHLGERVRTLHQGGTYSCRKMARFDLVSEHSYGNAIDVFAFTLESGKKVSVVSDFGPLDAEFEGLSPKAKFLRSLSEAAYDRDITSVSLSPYWDTLHRDHFHFDMARYRVDGSRPR